MTFTARTLADALRLAADEAQTLRTFIDDLDGWDGKDLDTGTNAWRTLDVLAQSLDHADDHQSASAGLETAGEAGIIGATGHCGVMLTMLLFSWAAALENDEPVTPVRMRQMLRSSLEISGGFMTFSPAIQMVIEESAREIAELGDTLPEAADVLNMYAAQCQFALVEATNQATGRIDPGAAVFTLVVTCLDAVVRDDVALLSSFAQMLADLAASHQPRGPRAHAPELDRAFTVDMVVSASRAECQELSDRLSVLGAGHSFTGHEDFFGVGEWRFHVDTAVPMAVYPRGMAVRSFTVVDARPHEMLGVDGLADGFVHRGVHILERPSTRRVERAHVIVLSNAPGMVEAFAQSGALVVLNPQPSDSQHILSLARASSTGVSVLIPTDAHTAKMARMLEEKAPLPLRVIVAPTADELAAQSVAQATATIFVPQPGGYQAAEQLSAVIDQAIQYSLSTFRSISVESAELDVLGGAIESLNLFGSRTWRLLLSKNANPQTSAIVQHLLQTKVHLSGAPDDNAFNTPSLDVIEGHYQGATVLQGIQ